MDHSGKETDTHELELLERVFLRVGAAESDEQLEKALNRFLTPTILQITSQHQSVQKKVLDLLTHVSKRVKSRPSVQLPFENLLSLYNEHEATPQVVNLSLVYLKLAYPRLPSLEQGRLLSQLVHSLKGHTKHQQDGVLQLIVPALVHLVLPKDLSERKRVLQLDDKEPARLVLLEFLLLYLLLPYNCEDFKSSQAPPGLSLNEFSCVTGGNFVDADQLEKVKLAILKLLSCEAFSAEEVICHFIVASGDPRHSVSDQGDHHLRQFGSSVDWEHAPVVLKLFSLFQGTQAVPGKRKRTDPDDAKNRCTPVSLRVRLRISPYFMKSVLAANSFPAAVQVIFDGLFGGNSNTKLQTNSLNFVHHICTSSSAHSILLMAPVLLTGLNKIVDQPAEEPKLKVLAYSAIGLIARRVPLLFQKETKHLHKLFDVLEKDLDQEMYLAVQECLSLMATAYKGVQGKSAVAVEALMLEHIYSEKVPARLAAVQCACAVFAFNHVPSRFVCIMACGDAANEVRHEGRKGLKPAVEGAIETPPAFTDMVLYLHKRAKLTSESGLAYKTAAGSLPYPPKALIEGIQFLRTCLVCSAGVPNEQRLANDFLLSLSQYFDAQFNTNPDAFNKYLDLLKQSLGPAGDSDLYSVVMQALLETVASAPRDVSLHLTSDIQWIRSFTYSSRTEVRESASPILGILAEHLEEPQFIALVEEVLQDTWSEVYHRKHGGLLSLGYVVSNSLRRAGDTETVEDDRVYKLLQRSLVRLVDVLQESTSAQLVLSACGSIGVLGRCGPLPLPTEASSTENTLSMSRLVEVLSKKLNTAKETKLKECFALTLGYLALGNPALPLKQVIVTGLFQVKEEKTIDLQFVVGQAMACTAAGPFCSVVRDPWRVSVKQPSVVVDEEIFPWTIDTVLTKFMVGTSPVVRQSACVWLLSLLKHCGAHPHLQEFLKRIQEAFMAMLTEQNDVIQEVASSGLGLVYELCDATIKKELVESLLGTLIEGKDTKVSSYKEICSLANDLNKPDLVYKFLNLSRHSSLWNSRKGAAFGFSTIATQAQEQLKPYIPTLVPKLYRYKYDPNPSIQLAMSNIWSALVRESKKTVDKFLSEILDDIVNNLNSDLWRNREASCMALSDLLPGRQAQEIVTCLPKLWQLCLRVLDDIKESVRKAADIACKGLSKVTLRLCDSTMSKTGATVVKTVLPLLLEKGMANPSPEVGAISLVTVMRISKNAGSLLKPHIALLVPAMLESLSSLEPQKLNTLSLQLSGDADIQEKLEDIRVAASKSSPMMETINLCLPFVDCDVLKTLVPKTVEILKGGVGLNTKVAAAQLVVSLVQECMSDLTPFAGKLLGALLSGLSDRSASIRKAYAKAIGHLVKVSKEASLVKMMTKVNSWYYEEDSPVSKSTVAQVLHSIVTYSHDAAKNMAVDFVPLVFLAMHSQSNDDDPSSDFTIKQWKEIWSDIVPRTEAGVRMYLKELIDVACPALQSQSWAVKAQAASAIATITENMKDKLGAPYLAQVLQSLLESLKGRIWEGKDTLLRCLSTVCLECKDAILSEKDSNQPKAGKILDSLLGQCKKQRPTYRITAITATAAAIEAFEVDMFAEFFEVILPTLDPVEREPDIASEVKHDIDVNYTAAQKLELKVAGFQALGQAWPRVSATHSQYYDRLCALLCNTLSVNNWKVQVAILCSLSKCFERLQIELTPDELSYLSNTTLTAVCKCLDETMFSAVRQKALLAIDKILLYLHDAGLLHKLPVETVDALKNVLVPLIEKEEVVKDIILKL